MAKIYKQYALVMKFCKMTLRIFARHSRRRFNWERENKSYFTNVVVHGDGIQLSFVIAFPRTTSPFQSSPHILPFKPSLRTENLSKNTRTTIKFTFGKVRVFRTCFSKAYPSACPHIPHVCHEMIFLSFLFLFPHFLVEARIKGNTKVRKREKRILDGNIFLNSFKMNIERM